MQKFLVFISFIFIAFSAFSFSTFKNQETVESSMFYILDDVDGKETVTGLGFFVGSNGTAYSNQHCITSVDRVKLKTLDGREYRISKVVAKGEKSGLIEFKVKLAAGDSVTALEIAEHAPYKDDEAFAVGISNDLEYTYYDGLVSTVYMFDGVGEGILTTIPVFKDLDGAPLLNDKGEVIGVFSLPFSEKFKFNFALSLENFGRMKEVEVEEVEVVQEFTHEELLEKYGAFYDSLFESEKRLQPIFDSIIDGWNMFVRIDAMTDFIKSFKKTLEIPGSYNYPFDSLKSIEKIYAPDNYFRIFNWTLKFDKESASFDKIMYRYLGVIQFNNPDSLEYVPLFDGKRNLEFGTEEDTILTNEAWYGVQYYDIQMIKRGKKKYYILLGWDGCDDISDKKVIEVLSFDENKMPVFGAPIFYAEKETDDGVEKSVKCRKIFQYNDVAIMALKFMPEKKAIVFDHLVPREKKHENKQWLYVPDGTYNAFKIKGAKLVYKNWLYEKSRRVDRYAKE